MNKCEIVVYNKGVDFEFLSNFYFKHFLFEVFWCSNSRYNGSHISICAYEVRKHFDLTFMRMNECEIVVCNKAKDFEILSNFCFEHILIRNCFGVQIVDTTDHM